MIALTDFVKLILLQGMSWHKMWKQIGTNMHNLSSLLNPLHWNMCHFQLYQQQPWPGWINSFCTLCYLLLSTLRPLIFFPTQKFLFHSEQRLSELAGDQAYNLILLLWRGLIYPSIWRLLKHPNSSQFQNQFRRFSRRADGGGRFSVSLDCPPSFSNCATYFSLFLLAKMDFLCVKLQ